MNKSLNVEQRWMCARIESTFLDTLCLQHAIPRANEDEAMTMREQHRQIVQKEKKN